MSIIIKTLKLITVRLSYVILFVNHFISLTAAGGSECERGLVTGSGLTGPVTC